MGLSKLHKMFIQGMLSKQYATEDEALRLWSDVSGQENTCDKKDLQKVIDEVNRSIKRFYIEVKSQLCEITGKNYYVMISNFSSPDETYDKCVHAYTHVEREFFRSILEEIVASNDRCMESIDALNLNVAGGSSQSQSWGPFEYNPILIKFIEDGWLVSKEEDEGKLFLGARAVAELEHVLLTVYKVDQCSLCSRVCMVGFVCDKCEINAHKHCLRTYGGKRAVTNKCYKCGNEMRT